MRRRSSTPSSTSCELDAPTSAVFDFGGLQAYPSRTKDPDVADFSTGSVGLGATAPLFAAAARRYIESHFGSDGQPARFIALVGDAGSTRATSGRRSPIPRCRARQRDVGRRRQRQSLDRVIPEMKVHKLMRVFADSGWHVVERSTGSGCAPPSSGPAERRCATSTTCRTRSTSRCSVLRAGNCVTGSAPAPMTRSVLRSMDVHDDDLAGLIHNLGGHDHKTLIAALDAPAMP